MTDIEADDRRKHKYNNIDHPFFFKPEFIMLSLTGSVMGAIGMTLWVTSEISAVAAIAVDNRSEISHVKDIQHKVHTDINRQVQEIKESQKDLKRDMSKGFDKLGGKIDRLIERELNHGGEH